MRIFLLMLVLAIAPLFPAVGLGADASSALLAAQGEGENRHGYRRELPGPTLKAQMEDESRHTFRGGGEVLLPLPPLAVAIEGGPEAAAWSRPLEKAPLIRLGANRSEADVILRSSPAPNAPAKRRVRVISGRLAAPDLEFLLPDYAGNLRDHLEGLARYRAATEAEGQMPRPEILWTIRMYAPAASPGPETILAEGRNWRLFRTMEVSGKEAKVRSRGPVLLRFSFANKSRSDYYVQILNYTPAGQILPVLPPAAQPGLTRLAAWGKDFSLEDLSLELSSQVEYLRLIVTKKPLDLAPLAQETFDSGPLGKAPEDSAAIAPADWCDSVVEFRLE